MSGFLSQKTAVAISVQADSETRDAIDINTDVHPIANLRPGNEVYTTPNPEYLGTVHAPGDFVLGRGVNDAFDIMLRGPGGTAPPVADEWVPGRILRGAGFEEIIAPTPLVPSEAIGAVDNTGETTKVVLGAAADALFTTDDECVGYPIIFSDTGAGAKGISSIIAYDAATNEVTLAEKFATPPAATYLIPAFIGYRLTAAAVPLYLTYDRWGDKKRYLHQNCVPSTLQFQMQTSNRGETALPILATGLAGDVDEDNDELDENSPTVASLGATAPVRAGDLWLAGVAVGGSTFTYDHGIQIGYPPNPNKDNGNDAGCIVRTARQVTMNLNEVALTTQDRSNMARLQGEHPIWLQFGIVSGKIVSFTVPKARLNHSVADPNGDFITRDIPFFIDGADNAVCIFFPYF